MYYVREAIDGQWKTVKLSEIEVEKLMRVTARRARKAILVARDEAALSAKEGIILTPAETLVIAQKIAPMYDDTVRDWLRKQAWKGTDPAAPATTTAAPVAAEVTTPK